MASSMSSACDLGMALAKSLPACTSSHKGWSLFHDELLAGCMPMSSSMWLETQLQILMLHHGHAGMFGAWQAPFPAVWSLGCHAACSHGWAMNVLCCHTFLICGACGLVGSGRAADDERPPKRHRTFQKSATICLLPDMLSCSPACARGTYAQLHITFTAHTLQCEQCGRKCCSLLLTQKHLASMVLASPFASPKCQNEVFTSNQTGEASTKPYVQPEGSG